LKSSEAFLRRVILSLQRDTIARHQFTIFVEDAQEYASVFTSPRRRFCKQKIGEERLDPNKNMSGEGEKSHGAAAPGHRSAGPLS
jgi:hypothetical protein